TLRADARRVHEFLDEIGVDAPTPARHHVYQAGYIRLFETLQGLIRSRSVLLHDFMLPGRHDRALRGKRRPCRPAAQAGAAGAMGSAPRAAADRSYRLRTPPRWPPPD